jgi:hypothetical protein
LRINFEWPDGRESSKDKVLDFSRHTWLPWDRLATAMSIRAMEYAANKGNSLRPVAFEGSFLEGIDVKWTARAFSRGNDDVFVRQFCKGDDANLESHLSFPVVWIFTPELHPEARWIVLQEPATYMAPHIRNRQAFQRAVAERGGSMVAVAAYGYQSDTHAEKTNASRMHADRHLGVTIFQPICWKNAQFAHWAELTRYRRNPFYHSSLFDTSVIPDIITRHKLTGDETSGSVPWMTIMILSALPFAERILPVVAPLGFQVDTLVYRQAKQRGIDVRVVPLDLFSQQDVERASLCHLVPAITVEPECVYPKWVEKQIGEQQTDNIDLVPQWVRDFGTRQ